MDRVLLLTVGMTPHKVIGWDAAVRMVYTTDKPKAAVIEETDEVIYRKGDLAVYMPSVIMLTAPIVGQKRAVKFSRQNLLTRDDYRCQYCRERKRAAELNYDHVTPRHQGGRTDWENIVMACYPCNSRKANRTPEQAGMRLLRRPTKPKSLPLMGPRFHPRDVHPTWLPYVQDSLDEQAVA